MTRREFTALGGAVCGAAGLGLAGAGRAEAVPPANVEAKISFKGLLGIAAPADWSSAKVLLFDSMNSPGHSQSLSYHLPKLSIPKSAVMTPVQAADQSSTTHWSWFLSKRRVTFDGASGATKRENTNTTCPTNALEWRDASFIADARNILNVGMAGGTVNPLYVSDTPAEWDKLYKEPVAAQIVLPAGTIACLVPSRPALLKSDFGFPDTGHRQPLTDLFVHEVTPVAALKIVITPFTGGAPIEIRLNQMAVDIEISNSMPIPPAVSTRHFSALFELQTNASRVPDYKAYKCGTETEIPKGDWENQGDDPIYCPPLRMYL